jgi:hypothetical protein
MEYYYRVERYTGDAWQTVRTSRSHPGPYDQIEKHRIVRRPFVCRYTGCHRKAIELQRDYGPICVDHAEIFYDM